MVFRLEVTRPQAPALGPGPAPAPAPKDDDYSDRWVLTRTEASDSQWEHVRFDSLLSRFPDLGELVLVLGALAHERRVLFVSASLERLSECGMAAVAVRPVEGG